MAFHLLLEEITSHQKDPLFILDDSASCLSPLYQNPKLLDVLAHQVLLLNCPFVL